MPKRYKCPYCNEKYERQKLIDHINDKHEDLMPDGYTASRVVFNNINNKEYGSCRICGNRTEWDESVSKYRVLCDNPKCKEEMRRRYQENMIRVRGTDNILNDPEQQQKMLANRKISGKYKFTDGGVVGFTGSYERKCLEFIDKVLEVPSNDILSPGPVIEYELEGQKHFYISDFYLITANLIIEVKDGGINPNNKDSEGMRSSRLKTIAKEKAVRDLGEYNYVRLTDNNFAQLLSILMEIKKINIEVNKVGPSNIIRVNEFSIINESDNTDPKHRKNVYLKTIKILKDNKINYKVSDSSVKKFINYEKTDFGYDLCISFNKENVNKAVKLVNPKIKSYGGKLSPDNYNTAFLSLKASSTITEAENNNIYYRVTYKNEGIYEALKKNIGHDEWNKLLKSESINWLPKPPKYDTGYQSYFTKDGYNKFNKTTLPIIEKYLDKRFIEVKKYLDSDLVVYRDKYQIVASQSLNNINEASLLEISRDDINNILTPYDIIAIKESLPIQIVNETCKDVPTARKFLLDVAKIAKKYNANYFIVTDGASATSGAKDNEVVAMMRQNMIEWEKNNGFNPDEDWSENPYDMSNYKLKEQSLLEITRDDINSMYLEKGDTCFNLNLWDANTDNNILWVTGISGSGKTTLGIDLAKEFNCYRVELDWISFYYMRKAIEKGKQKRCYNNIYNDCPIAVKFFDNNPIEKYGAREKFKDTMDIVKDFIDWFVPLVFSDGNLYIINGAHISEILPVEYFYNKPIIIKDINYIKTVARRTLREFEYDDDFITQITSAIKALKVGLSKSYRQANKDYKNYRKDLKQNANLVEPNNSITLYHATNIPNLDIISNNSYNVGNRFEKPRTSSFWFSDLDIAKSYAAMIAINTNSEIKALMGEDMIVRVCVSKSTLINMLKDFTSYVYYKQVDSSIIGSGHSGMLPEYTIDIPIKPDGCYVLTYREMLEYVSIVDQSEFDKLKNKIKSNKWRYKAAFGQKRFIGNILYYDKNEIDDRRKQLMKYKESTNISSSDTYPKALKTGSSKPYRDTELVESAIIENYIIPEDDLVINFDKWTKGTPLWITGSSGDGKTTLANKLAKEHNAVVIHTDILLTILITRISISKEEYNKMVKSYSEVGDKIVLRYVNYYNLPYSLLSAEKNGTKIWDLEDGGVSIYKNFFEWLIKEVQTTYRNSLLIIEGCDICSATDPHYMVSQPLIILSNSRLKSSFRRIKKDLESRNDNGTKMYTLIDALYREVNRGYVKNLDISKDRFRDEIEITINDKTKQLTKYKESANIFSSDILLPYNESREEIDMITYSEDFKDVMDIVNSLNKNELNNICSGTFKNSPYVVARKVAIIYGEPVAFIDAYSIPGEMNKDEVVIVCATKNKFRGNHLISILFNKMLPELKNAGINKIYWETTKSNKVSSYIAKNLGFTSGENINKDDDNYYMIVESNINESTYYEFKDVYKITEFLDFIADDGCHDALVKINNSKEWYRGRSDALVIKGDKVLLGATKDDYPSVPGGSWDGDEDHAISALRECKEEARVIAINPKYAGCYIKILDEPRKWVKEKIPKEYWWRHYYTEVYVCEYKGRYNGYIDPLDVDDFAKTGKFYDIDKVFDTLNPAHQKALEPYLMRIKAKKGLTKSSIITEVKSTVNPNYKPDKKISLSSLKMIHITEAVINKYKKEYPSLSHVRCKDTKEYVCDGYMWFDDNKLVATVGSCEYRDDKTKWIVSLEITKEYRGHGLSNQILDYAVKTMNCKYLSVNKNNKLAKKIYDDYGFKVYQSDNTMYYMTIDTKSIKESKMPDEIPQEITDLLKQLNSYDYGFVDKDGKRVKGMNNFFEDYTSLTISEFEKYKIGVCWDYVHYEAYWFKKHGYKYETFYIQVQDEDSDCPSHTYLVFYLPEDDKPYYFESSWDKFEGIEKFNSINELHDTIKDRHIKNAKSKCDTSSYFREKYDAESKLWEHLSCGDYMVKISKGRIKISEATDGSISFEGLDSDIVEVSNNEDQASKSNNKKQFKKSLDKINKLFKGKEIIDAYDGDEEYKSKYIL